MRTFHGWLMLLLAATVSQSTLAAPMQLRILTFNIKHCEGMDNKVDLARTAAVIVRLKPDLVALQEVDSKTKRVEGVDQTAELAKLTGMHGFFGKAIDYSGGEYGASVLSRWPFKKTSANALPGSPGHEQRPATIVQVTPSDGPTLTFVSIHLDQKADSERLTQSRRLLELLEGRGTVIIGGDFNARPESPVLELFAKDWLNATAGETRLTIPSTKPTRQIDFVLARPRNAWRVIETSVIDDSVTSDHRPVLAILEWKFSE